MLLTGHLPPMTYIVLQHLLHHLRDKLHNCSTRVCYLYLSRFQTVSIKSFITKVNENKVFFYFEILSLLSLVSVDVVQVDQNRVLIIFIRITTRVTGDDKF